MIFFDGIFLKQYLLDLKTPFLVFSRDVLPPKISCGPSKWSIKFTKSRKNPEKSQNLEKNQSEQNFSMILGSTIVTQHPRDLKTLFLTISEHF